MGINGMKKRILLMIIALLCCSACLAGAEDAVSLPEAYEPILEMVRKGMAGDPDTLENEDFNSVIYLESHYSSQKVGWALLDLDEDGEDELLIGRTAYDPETDVLWIFDIWTMAEDKARLFDRGWERKRMYLTAEGSRKCYGLYFEGADSAFESIFEHCLIRGLEKSEQETIICFTDVDTDTVTWTLNDAEIEEAEALRMIDEWKSIICPVKMTALE